MKRGGRAVSPRQGSNSVKGHGPHTAASQGEREVWIGPGNQLTGTPILLMYVSCKACGCTFVDARAPNGVSAPPDPRRVRLPVFFWALLSWERGSSTGKAVQTLEETVQVIYFSLQTVCFSSVEKFHPDCPPPSFPGQMCTFKRIKITRLVLLFT